MTQQPDPRQPGRPANPANPEPEQPPAQPEHPGGQSIAGATDDGRGFVIGPRGMAIEDPPNGDKDKPANDSSVTNQVEEPAKVMRIGNMIRALLEEIRVAPIDTPSRDRLRSTYQTSIQELKSGLSDELADELERVTEPFTSETTPSNDELRIAKAQLVGWLEGLFQGIQTALVAQQMAARAQLEQMRRTALPSGPGQVPAQGQQPIQQPNGSDGMYL